MEPKFQTSFIPKKPIINSPIRTSPAISSLFSVLAGIIFVITLVTFGFLLVYKNVLKNQIAKADQDINSAREAFQLVKIQELIDANARIIAVKGLLEKHIVVSPLLSLLQTLTIQTIQLNDLTYSNKNNNPSVFTNLQSKTYNSLANQSDAFSKNQYFRTSDFSDFNLGPNGSIQVKFFANLDPKLTSYKNAIESLLLNQ